MKYRVIAGSTALLLASCATAQTMQQVTVTASKTAEREQSTTTSIVIGREEILRQGDSTLADVLKRQPGITIDGTPGRPAAIRMRGLGNGYASILLDGLPAPAGFSIESISPELIERIEIMRAATAEFSNQAIAGSINVVLRKNIAKAQGELKAGAGFLDGRAAPTLVAQRSGRSGTLAYTLAATARRADHQVTSTAVEEGIAPDLLRYIDLNDRMVQDSVELAPRLSWQPDERDTLVSQTFVRWRRIDNRKLEHETTVRGQPTDFPIALSRYRTRPFNVYSDLSWTRQLAAGAQLSTKLSGAYSTQDADFVFRGADAANEPTGLHLVASGPTESDVTLNGTYRRPLGENHSLAAGWEAGQKQRNEYRREQQFDAAGTNVLSTDEHYDAQVRRIALFVQDEWELGPRASLYLGLRREDLYTTGAGNAHGAVDVHSGVWSPIVQALFKRGAAKGAGPRDQVRLALTRTYKAPPIAQLMPRRYTVDNNNSATNPDQQGNPNLRPELAFGLDAAWERYFGKDNLVSVSTYIKRIRDVTVDRIYRQGDVWIVTPDNNGDAVVRGIELDARLNWPGGLATRANVARNWSRVEEVPGPDNRLDRQPPLTASLGLDYKPAAAAWSGGGTFSYRSGGPARQSATLSSYASAKRELDLYAVWQLSAKARLRVSAANLGHPRYVGQSVFADGRQYLSRTTTGRTFTAWRVMWEQTL